MFNLKTDGVRKFGCVDAFRNKVRLTTRSRHAGTRIANVFASSTKRGPCMRCTILRVSCVCLAVAAFYSDEAYAAC